MADRSACGFTLIHLVAIIAIVVMLFIFFLGLGHGQHEISYKIKCSSNLRQIGLAMKMYSNTERGNAFPRTRFDPSAVDHPTAYTGVNASNPFDNDGPAPNDVTAAIFLILRTQEITTDVFVCPASERSGLAERIEIPPGKTIQSFSNFPSQKNLGYSTHNPYAAEVRDAAGKVVATWADTISSDFAIMADINPGVADVAKVAFQSPAAEQRKANSPNHDYDGQNVLYADDHVEWSASVWAGAQQDNIYTFQKDPSKPTGESGGIVGPPAGPEDSVMLPIWDPTVPLPDPS